MKAVFTLLLLVLLSACATGAKYQKNIAGWIGQKEARLVSLNGPPTMVYPIDGIGKMLTYVDQEVDCQTHFTVDKEGIIIASKSTGMWCVSN